VTLILVPFKISVSFRLVLFAVGIVVGSHRRFYARTCSVTGDFLELIFSAYSRRINHRTTLLSDNDIAAAKALHSFLVAASI
jgi:hypothetical protein